MKNFLASLDRSVPAEDAAYRAGVRSLMIGMSMTDAYADAVKAMLPLLPEGQWIPKPMEQEITAHAESIRSGAGSAVGRLFDDVVGRGR